MNVQQYQTTDNRKYLKVIELLLNRNIPILDKSQDTKTRTEQTVDWSGCSGQAYDKNFTPSTYTVTETTYTIFYESVEPLF